MSDTVDTRPNVRTARKAGSTASVRVQFGLIHEGQRINHTLKTRNWTTATQKVVQMERAFVLGEFRNRKRITDAITLFLDSRDVEVSSIKRYNRVLASFLRFAERGSIDYVDEVRIDAMDAYQSERRPDLAPLSWAKEFDVLKAYFRFCTSRDWCEKDPMRQMSAPRNPKPRDR